jgi:hypothetical protein
MRPPIVGENYQYLKWLVGHRIGPAGINGGFLPFAPFGTVPATSPIWPPDQPAAGSGRLTMTFNFASLQHIAVSAIGAIVTATLFISAAVGPAGQIV